MNNLKQNNRVECINCGFTRSTILETKANCLRGKVHDFGDHGISFPKPLEEIKEEFYKKFPPPMLLGQNQEWVADWWIDKILSYHKEKMAVLRKKVEKMNFRNNPKGYDGNSLEDASDFHRIAAENWAEVIRYEVGHDDALSEILTLLEDPNTSK